MYTQICLYFNQLLKGKYGLKKNHNGSVRSQSTAVSLIHTWTGCAGYETSSTATLFRMLHLEKFNNRKKQYFPWAVTIFSFNLKVYVPSDSLGYFANFSSSNKNPVSGRLSNKDI